MISLRTRTMVVSLEPTRGGKVTSLFHVPSGREWLESSAQSLEGSIEQNESFDDGDMSGWDEMMPTIEACIYPDSNISLADHGQLWRQAWTVTASDDTSVTTLVRDEVLGYRLERTLQVTDSTLSIEYRATSEIDVARWLLWAAHPLFTYRRGSRVVLRGLGRVTRPWDSPEAVGTQGGFCLDDVETGDSYKFFIPATSSSPSATLIDTDGAYLDMSWMRSDAPFLGIWLDNCSLSRHGVIAFEPTNANCDALDLAIETGASSLLGLKPRENHVWRMDVTLGSDFATNGVAMPSKPTRNSDQ